MPRALSANIVMSAAALERKITNAIGPLCLLRNGALYVGLYTGSIPRNNGATLNGQGRFAQSARQDLQRQPRQEAARPGQESGGGHAHERGARPQRQASLRRRDASLFRGTLR